MPQMQRASSKARDLRRTNICLRGLRQRRSPPSCRELAEGRTWQIVGIAMAKRAITIRVDPEVLHLARKAAKQDNRTLTNFIETVIKERVTIERPKQSKGS